MNARDRDYPLRSLAGDARFRAAVAESVHHAVTALTGDDGCGHCDLYCLAGTTLLRHLTGLPYQPQVGSMMFLADPAGNGWMEIRATDGGIDRFEFHAWVGLAGCRIAGSDGPGSPPLCALAEIVDLSTRHLRSMVDRMQRVASARRVGDGFLLTLREPDDPITWTRPDGPPPYLWASEVPDEFRYEPDAAACRDYCDRGMPPRESLHRLALEARAHFDATFQP